jgi:hypothetical protein
MVQDIEMHQFLHRILDVLDSRIAKLNHFVTVGANEVIVLLVAVRFFVLCQILAKLVLAHQVAFDKQIQRIINRGPTHAVVFVFHVEVQGLDIKMTVQ